MSTVNYKCEGSSESDSFLVYCSIIMLGKVYGLIPDPKGFIRFIIQCKLPYRSFFKKYTIWNLPRLQARLGELKEGTMVKFDEDAESRYPVLTSLELAALDTCFTCHSFYEVGDAQRLDCGQCREGEQRRRVDEPLKLVSTREKDYTYSRGVAMTFINDDETCTFSTCVFANNPLYQGLLLLTSGDSYLVKGWITQETPGVDGTKALMELEDVPE